MTLNRHQAFTIRTAEERHVCVFNSITDSIKSSEEQSRLRQGTVKNFDPMP